MEGKLSATELARLEDMWLNKVVAFCKGDPGTDYTYLDTLDRKDSNQLTTMFPQEFEQILKRAEKCKAITDAEKELAEMDELAALDNTELRGLNPTP